MTLPHGLSPDTTLGTMSPKLSSSLSSPWFRTSAAANLVDSEGGLRPTIFEEMTGLAQRFDAINLGQGFPDTDGPAELAELAATLISNDDAAARRNQYAPGSGILPLREAIARHQHRHYGLQLNPETEILVSTGATEALAASLMAFLSPGDEVVTFEPFYDSYAAVTALTNATLVPVPLTLSDAGARPDLERFAQAVTEKTRIILLNSPHNPCGVVFTQDELRVIADAATAHDCIIISDEVYEHLTFGSPHIPIATLEGAFERTITISSAGKAFSMTGWKVGWASGPAPLIAAVKSVKQFLSYSSGPAFQPAVAHGLDHGEEWFESLRTDLREGRDILVNGLREAGLRVIEPEGTYFVIADVSFLGVTSAADLARLLPEHAGVAGIPVEVFAIPEHQSEFSSWIRFAFCKRPEVLHDAVARLKDGLPRTAAVLKAAAATGDNA